jgi:putative transposase
MAKEARMLTCTKPEIVALLGEFIQNASDARERQRALAVRMAVEDKPYEEIAESLGVYKSFITRWKQEFYEQVIEGLKLSYRGRKGYLSEAERQGIIDWLKKGYWS